MVSEGHWADDSPQSTSTSAGHLPPCITHRSEVLSTLYLMMCCQFVCMPLNNYYTMVVFKQICIFGLGDWLTEQCRFVFPPAPVSLPPPPSRPQCQPLRPTGGTLEVSQTVWAHQAQRT